MLETKEPAQRREVGSGEPMSFEAALSALLKLQREGYRGLKLKSVKGGFVITVPVKEKNPSDT